MSIADEKGTVYEVHHPEELLLSTDNNELMSVLKYTFIAKTLNEDFKVLGDNGTYSQEEMPENLEKIISSLNDGVEYMKDYLSAIFSKDEIELELLDTKRNMYGKKHGFNN